MKIQKFLQLVTETFKTLDESIIIEGKNLNSDVKELNININPLVKNILNLAVRCLDADEIYCEITENLGETLISALENNLGAIAYGIIENSTLNLEEIINNLQKYNCHEKVCFYEGNISSFCEDLSFLDSPEKIGTFYLNGDTSYRKILQNLMMIKDFLGEESFIIVSNLQTEECKSAIEDFQTFNKNNCNNIQPLLTINKESKLSSLFKEELIILLWQNNLLKKEIKTINQRGLKKLDESIKQNRKILLHVGCGVYNPHLLPQQFQSDDWIEIRLDIDPNVKPDIIGTITDLNIIPDHSVDAVYSSHNLEHIYNFEVPIALQEFKRVLKTNGFIMITLPDIEQVAHHVAQGNLEIPLYISPAGPICAIDILYGLGSALAQGSYYMAHKTAFTDKTLADKIIEVGFKNVTVTKDNHFNLWAIAYK